MPSTREHIADVLLRLGGGEDSIVVLDMSMRALPHSAFKVMFGDTGIEFPDTYRTVDKVEAWCKAEGI